MISIGLSQDNFKLVTKSLINLHPTKLRILNLFLYRIKRYGAVKLSIQKIANAVGIKPRQINNNLQYLSKQYVNGKPLLTIINHGRRSMKINDYVLHPYIMSEDYSLRLDTFILVKDQRKFQVSESMVVVNGYRLSNRTDCTHIIYKEYNKSLKLSRVAQIIEDYVPEVIRSWREILKNRYLAQEDYTTWGNAPSLVGTS